MCCASGPHQGVQTPGIGHEMLELERAVTSVSQGAVPIRGPPRRGEGSGFADTGTRWPSGFSTGWDGLQSFICLSLTCRRGGREGTGSVAVRLVAVDPTLLDSRERLPRSPSTSPPPPLRATVSLAPLVHADFWSSLSP